MVIMQQIQSSVEQIEIGHEQNLQPRENVIWIKRQVDEDFSKQGMALQRQRLPGKQKKDNW